MPPQDGSPALRVRADRHHWWVREGSAPGSDQPDVDLRVRPGLEVGSIEGPVSPLAKVLAFSFVHLPLPAQCLRRREPVEVRGDFNQIGDGTQALGAGPRFGRLAHGLALRLRHRPTHGCIVAIPVALTERMQALLGAGEQSVSVQPWNRL